jgi:hypothetical protein
LRELHIQQVRTDHDKIGNQSRLSSAAPCATTTK